MKTAFGNAAVIASEVVTLPNSRIVVAGESGNQWALAGFFPDGTPDNTFADDGKLLIDLGQPGSSGVQSLVRAATGGCWRPAAYTPPCGTASGRRMPPAKRGSDMPRPRARHCACGWASRCRWPNHPSSRPSCSTRMA
ncbi:hypothetical protein HC891_24215, partial [Candidatus Gracilibacteria bacterium]|nr:hypothetical protein [Candidatus Gracilibacteria bacterium]